MKYIEKTLNYTKIKSCRVCDSKQLSTVANFGELKISTFVDKPKEHIGSAPLELLECADCTLVQLAHTVPPNVMYHTYWYESATNKVLADNLKDIVRQIKKEISISDYDIVFDIGANDGTLLKEYTPGNEYMNAGARIGCEPAKNILHKLEENCEYVINDFWDIKHYKWPLAKVITAIGMFYDMEDPNKFIQDIKNVLREDGIFVSQLMTLLPMLKQNDLGNICHEHLEYYTYKSLVTLFEQNGLEIYKVVENNIHGGSYQLWARHYKEGSIPFEEDKPDFKNFIDTINTNRKKCLDFISSCSNVYIYGASTKGNTILQYYGLNNTHIKGAAEIDSKKIGKYTVGSDIPIVHEDEAKEHAEYFLVLPYSFKEYFMNNNKDWQGKWIFCTPEFEYV